MESSEHGCTMLFTAADSSLEVQLEGPNNPSAAGDSAEHRLFASASLMPASQHPLLDATRKH